ncbi:hypothetical protein BGY98DRAFT_1179456 [Russula aff. rugulosa BPL654]|nr:hypothetical protein BGY98DRAFT_1179456 [Russula aff. rugulosa BPL654]
MDWCKGIYALALPERFIVEALIALAPSERNAWRITCKGGWLGSLRTQPGKRSKLPWGLRAEQWAATSLMTQGRPTEGGGNGRGERGDSKEIAIEGDTTGDSTCLYKTSEILLIYYKESYPKGHGNFHQNNPRIDQTKPQRAKQSQGPPFWRATFYAFPTPTRHNSQPDTIRTLMFIKKRLHLKNARAKATQAVRPLRR